MFCFLLFAEDDFEQMKAQACSEGDEKRGFCTPRKTVEPLENFEELLP